MTDTPERLFFHTALPLPGNTIDGELRVGTDRECPDDPMLTCTPTPRDVALAICGASDQWFMGFVTELKRCDIRVAMAAVFEPLPPHDPDFGVDPEDSARLLELRDAIDSYLGWKSQEDEEEGNYVFRIREIGDMLWNCKVAFIEHYDPALMAQILLSVTKQAGKSLRPHPTINHRLDVAGAASEAGRCSCMAHVHGHPGGVCQAAGASWHKEDGWPDLLMLCPLCIKHPADEAILSASKRAERGEKLEAQNRRQRAELRRFNREARARAEERAGQRVEVFRSPAAMEALEKSMSEMTTERIEEVLTVGPKGIP